MNLNDQPSLPDPPRQREALRRWERPLPLVHALAWFFGVGVLYWAVSVLGLMFTGLGAEVSVFWPGAGLALGLMVISPKRARPIIAAAILVSNLNANLGVGRGAEVSIGFAAVNGLMPWIAAWLLNRRESKRFDLREPADLFRLFAWGAVASCGLGAVLAATWLTMLTDIGAWWAIVRAWWSADALGLLLVAPVVIGWRDPAWAFRPIPWRACEGIALLVTAVVLSLMVFYGWFGPVPAFLGMSASVFPALLWSALRFGVPGAGILTMLTAGVAVAGTRAGYGPFIRAGASGADQVTAAQGTIAIFGIAAQVTATAIRAWRERAAALRQERRNWDSAFDRTPAGFAIILPSGRFGRVNEALAGMVGRDVESLRGLEAVMVLHPEDQDRFISDLEGIVRGNDTAPQRLVRCPRRAPGDMAYVLLHLTGVRNDAGCLVHCFAQFIDVTREHRVEAALRESEKRLKLALGNAGHGMWDWDITSGSCILDDGWQVIHGHEPGTMAPSVATWEETIHPEDRPRVYEVLQRHLSDDSCAYDIDYRARRADGTYVWVNTRGKVQSRDPSGRALRMMGTIHDISGRKAAEERLRQTIRDKEVLLREIHHRVKNNLAAVSGLLLLRSNQTADPELKAAFMESRDRVRAIGLVHDTLHRSDHLDRVDLSSYLRSLATQVAGTMADATLRIEVEVRAEPIVIDTQTAVPCGLIVNELITNCYKHAFHDRTEGRIDISAAVEGSECVIVVRDNGVGGRLPEDESGTLGLRLMRSLASQLGGYVRFTASTDGFEGRLVFAHKSE